MEIDTSICRVALTTPAHNACILENICFDGSMVEFALGKGEITVQFCVEAPDSKCDVKHIGERSP